MARDALATYRRKRDFSRTREPRGGRSPRGRRFLVQKHDARRLHYDLRLEVDGVLKSWAVTRGPSLDPGDKRLAVRTEDHPLEYAEFEGTIPAGEYGGGTVMLWDQGTWEPLAGKEGDEGKDLAEGHLHFVVHGERMRGEWVLIRMRPRRGEKRENWLLRKVADRHASGKSLVGRELTSVSSGRSMAEIAAGRTAGRRRRKRVRGTLPAFRPPQLATLVDRVPIGDDWLHEVKFDGYRCLAAAAGTRVRFYTRSGLDWTDRFAALVKPLADLDLPPVLLDGEVVALDSAGNPDFARLQQELSAMSGDLTYFAFDLLMAEGDDLTALPLLERKARLAALLPANGRIRVAEHVLGAGGDLYDAMCRAGQEGIISKRVDARYSGGRTRTWVKVKCSRREEFVLVGWTASRAAGRPFGSLLLAQREADGLVYRGKVGTGFSEDTLERLGATLRRLHRKTPPLSLPSSAARGVSWVSPKLVAEIGYAERTTAGLVRQARFLGLREDKPAEAVHPEIPVSLPEEAQVRITHPDRVIFPDAGITKGDLARYYRGAVALMLPFLDRRPLSLVRCPQGRARKCFFQKHVTGGFGDHVNEVRIREKDGTRASYFHLDDASGLLQCVQMGTIEFHGWGSRADDIEHPDRLVFDLDPAEGLDFEQVRSAARHLRDQLAELGLASFPLLSGGKGVHVVVPLTPSARWPAVKDFARRFASALATADPERFTATMTKAKRTGRIFIDWLRNQRGATSIVPYSARARAGAPVAAPVSWEELRRIERPDAFTVADLTRLLKRAGQARLRGWGIAQQELPDA